MNGRFIRAAAGAVTDGRFNRAAAGAITTGLMAIAAGGTQSALAAQRGVATVPCSAAAPTATIKGADSGETLSLAPSAATASPPLCRPAWKPPYQRRPRHHQAKRLGPRNSPPSRWVSTTRQQSGPWRPATLISAMEPWNQSRQGSLSVQDGTFISNHAAAAGAITFFDQTDRDRQRLHHEPRHPRRHSRHHRHAVAGNLPDNRATDATGACRGVEVVPCRGDPCRSTTTVISPVPAAGTDRPAAERTRGPGSPPGTWPPTKVAGCYTPRSASRRPEAMAALKAWKSCSFWSAYAAAKSAIALSNAADPPR